MSERLGHSSVAFTLDTYAHVMPGMQPESAELFDGLVFGSQTDQPENAPASRCGASRFVRSQRDQR